MKGSEDVALPGWTLSSHWNASLGPRGERTSPMCETTTGGRGSCSKPAALRGCSRRRRTQGPNEEVDLKGHRAEEARDASSRQHGHVGRGPERAFGEVGPRQAGPGLGFPGGGGPGMECEAGGVHVGAGGDSPLQAMKQHP